MKKWKVNLYRIQLEVPVEVEAETAEEAKEKALPLAHYRDAVPPARRWIADVVEAPVDEVKLAPEPPLPVTLPAPVETMEVKPAETPERRKPGRPPGSKSKPKAEPAQRVGLFGKKKNPPKREEPGGPPRLGLKERVVAWYVTRWVRDGLAGKHGGNVMKWLQNLAGARTAILALVLVSEVVANAFGLNAGPVFGILRTVLASVGADPGAVTQALGVDPVVLGTAVATVAAAILRLKAWAAQRKAAQPASAGK